MTHDSGHDKPMHHFSTTLGQEKPTLRLFSFSFFIYKKEKVLAKLGVVSFFLVMRRTISKFCNDFESRLSELRRCQFQTQKGVFFQLSKFENLKKIITSFKHLH